MSRGMVIREPDSTLHFSLTCLKSRKRAAKTAEVKTMETASFIRVLQNGCFKTCGSCVLEHGKIYLFLSNAITFFKY